jgi:hypothetical protein
MKQTAVEKLFKIWLEKEYITDNEWLEAIELNKNQIVDAVDTTIERMNVLDNFRTLKNGEQYYNETFKEQ